MVERELGRERKRKRGGGERRVIRTRRYPAGFLSKRDLRIKGGGRRGGGNGLYIRILGVGC